jgi:Mn2+/Fe2+ NRAMP family transporter
MNLGQAIYHQFSTGRRKHSVPVLVAICILSGTVAYQTGNLLGAMAGVELLHGFPGWIVILVLGLTAGILLMVPSVRMIARIMGGIVAVMGIAFLVSAVAIKPPALELLRGIVRPIIPVSQGGGLLILGLIGTTVVPYNLFLGSGLSEGQSIGQMRSGLFIAVILGGIISMAVLITGSSLTGEFSFEALAGSLGHHTGTIGTIILGVGLFAAGFTSAVTAPLASAVTIRSLFGNRNRESWKDGSLRFRIVWLAVLLTGMGFGMAGFQPVPAIVLAQALNGLILPLIAVFLFSAVNNKEMMEESVNRLAGNILMTVIVYITLIIGLTGVVRAVLRALNVEDLNWDILMLGIAIASFIIMALVLLRQTKNLHNHPSSHGSAIV